MENEMSETDGNRGEIPDLFAFGGYRLSDEEVRALLRPPLVGGHAGGHGSVPSVAEPKPRRMSLLARKATELLVRPVMQSDEGRYGAKVGLLQLVVQRIRERLEEEKVWSCAKVEYVSQLQYYPHLTHCDFVLSEMHKREFVEVVAERFVQEFLKAGAAYRGMWFVVPTLPGLRAVEFERLFEFGGLVMRGVCDYHVVTDQLMVRLDCLWAVATKESLICQDQMRLPIGTGSGAGLIRRG